MTKISSDSKSRHRSEITNRFLRINTRLKRTLSIATILSSVALAGCLTAYVPPAEGVPTAEVSYTGSGYSGTYQFFVGDGLAAETFSAEEHVAVRVPAGRMTEFFARGVAVGSFGFCGHRATFIPRAGKSYAFEQAFGPMGCSLRVLDIATGQPPSDLQIMAH